MNENNPTKLTMSENDPKVQSAAKRGPTVAKDVSPEAPSSVIVPTEQDVKDAKHLQIVMRHIKHVQDGCLLMAERMKDQGESDFARLLIQKSYHHDNSKFVGIEWEHLRVCNDNQELFKQAIHQHQMTNDHHPEYWSGIKNMPDICVAEMVADWYARSTEFGTNLRDWIKNSACQKYSITPQTKAYKTIKGFVDLILDDPFK